MPRARPLAVATDSAACLSSTPESLDSLTTRGREPGSLADLNAELRRWISEVANQRVHGTTHERVLIRWDEDRVNLQAVKG